MSVEAALAAEAGETVWRPILVSAAFAPNPAAVGQPALLRVMVVDVFGGEQTEVRCAGEWCAGEV